MQRKNLGKAMRYLVAAVCALVSALALVGCGGGDDDGVPAGARCGRIRPQQCPGSCRPPARLLSCRARPLLFPVARSSMQVPLQ